MPLRTMRAHNYFLIYRIPVFLFPTVLSHAKRPTKFPCKTSSAATYTYVKTKGRVEIIYLTANKKEKEKEKKGGENVRNVTIPVSLQLLP